MCGTSKWTTNIVFKQFSLKVSLAYAHRLFKRFDWHRVKVKYQHPEQINSRIEVLITNFLISFGTIFKN